MTHRTTHTLHSIWPLREAVLPVDTSQAVAGVDCVVYEVKTVHTKERKASLRKANGR